MAKKSDKVAVYWNKRGKTYSRSWQSVAKKRLSRMETGLIHKAFVSLKNELRNNKVRSLDIGIGIGRITKEIIKYNVDHYGTDVSETMIRFCQEKFKNNKKIKQLKVHNILKPLPPSWGRFDIVSAYRVLSYNPNSQLARELANIYKAMNPRGIFIFTYPNKYSSAFLPKILNGKSRLGYELSYQELRKIVESAGFSEYHIIGFSRLLDTFYDWSNNNISANILFAVEKFMSLILGQTLFVRLFYVTCKK